MNIFLHFWFALRKHSFKIAFILCGLVFSGAVVFLIGYQFLHPDMTQTRVIINNWGIFLSLWMNVFALGIIWNLANKYGWDWK